MLLLLDLLSTACFAGTAASIAMHCKLNVGGVFVSAMIASTGGGTTRELILGSRTLFWLETPAFVYVVLGAILIAYLLRHRNHLAEFMIKPADSFATATFIVVGVTAAFNAECNLLVCLLMGVLTGVGGGIIRQVVFDRASLRYNHINILAATFAALICVNLILQSVNLLVIVVLLGLVHLTITSKSTICLLLRFIYPWYQGGVQNACAKPNHTQR